MMKMFRILAVAIFTLTLLFVNSNIVLAEENDISALGECSVQKKYTMYLGTNDNIKESANRSIFYQEKMIK